MADKWYHVSYDLTKPDSEDYDNLIERIEKFPECGHILKSSWIINSNKTASEIKKSLINTVEKNIRIFYLRNRQKLCISSKEIGWGFS